MKDDLPRTRRLPPDPRRKARFREIARGIVAEDRSDRRYGLTVDTAGAIAQALERAYRDGVHAGPGASAAASAPPDTGPIEWALIPPRPRDAFWSICLFILGDDDRQSHDGYLAPAVTPRGTPGWTLVTSGRNSGRLIGNRTTAPLVRLGLIERAADLPVRLVVTARGQETWTIFRRRGGRYPEDLTDI